MCCNCQGLICEVLPPGVGKLEVEGKPENLISPG